MPVYNGSTKQGTLYYGGSKIKEAYYGSTKVYSSGPLYYCYRANLYASGTYYIYVYTKELVVSVREYVAYDNNLEQVSTSSQLTGSGNFTPTSISSNSFVYGGYTYTYYQDGDLYT